VWALLGLLLLLCFNVVFNIRFFSLEIKEGHLYGTLVDVLKLSTPGMLLALGMTLVIATGGVDLSVGSVMAISGAVAARLVTETSIPFAVVVPIALGVTTAAGAWNGILVGYARIQPIVATLILMVAGRGVAKLLTREQIITFEHPAFVYIGNEHLLGLPFTAVIAVVMVTVTALVTRKTAIGLFIESVGSNETASRYAGISTRATKVLVYAFAGLCAGIAGLIAASDIKGADSINAGKYMELDAIFAVVVGGTALTGGRFTLAGSVIGALLIQTLVTTMHYVGVPSHVDPVPKALVIVAVCLLQSSTFRARAQALFMKIAPPVYRVLRPALAPLGRLSRRIWARVRGLSRRAGP
jgi:simple sugar transport system permease protein